MNTTARSRHRGLGILAAPLAALAAVALGAACSAEETTATDDGGDPHGDVDASVRADAPGTTRDGRPPATDGTTEPEEDATVTVDGSKPPGKDSGVVVPGGPCGYKNKGEVVKVSADIEVCLPPVVCTPSETCPRGLGTCVNGKCQFAAGYSGIATLPEAWSTYYCDLKTGGCNGAVQNPLPYDVAKTVAATFGPVCADQPGATGTCVGIVAPPPVMAGNSQVAVDPATGKKVALWGLGMTAASGVCYEITGSGGTAVVAVTDRCAGYCKCGASDFNECGNCINAADTQTQCACVGTAPPLHDHCCGRGCSETKQCDWCANNNHPHFDLDTATFDHVCGPSGQTFGSCKLKSVKVIKDCYPPRPSWPN
jgi:hypothetical protein